MADKIKPFVVVVAAAAAEIQNLRTQLTSTFSNLLLLHLQAIS
jgi:hypothetical protein